MILYSFITFSCEEFHGEPVNDKDLHLGSVFFVILALLAELIVKLVKSCPSVCLCVNQDGIDHNR